jgi:hypothetical protein
MGQFGCGSPFTETQIYTAKKGAFVSIPKGGAIHAFKNESASDARILCVVVAAGLEEFFQEIGQPVAYGEILPVSEMMPEDAAELQSIAAKYEQEVFPPDYFVTKTK